MIVQNTIGDFVNQFLVQKKQRNTNTFVNYKSDIEHFFDVTFGKSYNDVTIEEFNSEKSSVDGLMAFFENLFNIEKDNGERAFSNGTINRKQAALKSLLKFLKRKRVCQHDITDLQAIQSLPKRARNIEVLSFVRSMEYAEYMLENEKYKKLEKYMIIRLAVDTGARAQELLDLKWTQFRVDENNVVLSGYGKGDVKWQECISLDFYNEILALKGSSKKVFSLSYSNLVKMMNRAKKALGDEERAISFHSFKKCSVTSAYRVTNDIMAAKRKARHSSLNDTILYIEEIDYGITGMISLGVEGTDSELYKKVDPEVLYAALGDMNKDFLFILNAKIREKEKKIV